MSLKLLKDGGYEVRIQGKKGSKEQIIRFFRFQITFEPLKAPVINFQNAARSASSTPSPSAYVQTLEFVEAGPTQSEIEFYVDNEASQGKMSPDVDSSSSSNVELFDPEAANPISGITDPIAQELRRFRETFEKKKKSALAASGKGNRAFAQLLKQRNEPKKPDAVADTSKKSGSSKTGKANERKERSPQKATSSKVTTEESSKVGKKTASVPPRPVIKPILAKSVKTVFKRPNSQQKPRFGSVGKSAADSSGQVFRGINSRRNDITHGNAAQVSLSQFPIALRAPGVSIRKAREPSPEFTAPVSKRKVSKEKKKKHRNRRLQRGDSASSSSSSEDEEEMQPPPLQAIQSQPSILAPVKQPSQQQSKPSMPNLFAEPESREAEEEPEETEPPTLTCERNVIDGVNNNKAGDRSRVDEENDVGSSSATTEESSHGSADDENADVLDLCVSDDEFGF